MPHPRTPMQEVQDRMGITNVEELLAERDALVKTVAPLRARHGQGGVYNDQRKILLATIATKLRVEALEKAYKLTEAACDDAAHAAPEYIAFVERAAIEKAEWAIQENTIDGITETINRGQVVGRYLSQEVGLSK